MLGHVLKPFICHCSYPKIPTGSSASQHAAQACGSQSPCRSQARTRYTQRCTHSPRGRARIHACHPLNALSHHSNPHNNLHDPRINQLSNPAWHQTRVRFPHPLFKLAARHRTRVRFPHPLFKLAARISTAPSHFYTSHSPIKLSVETKKTNLPWRMLNAKRYGQHAVLSPPLPPCIYYLSPDDLSILPSSVPTIFITSACRVELISNTATGNL
jgi:hypothetical protein